MLPSSVLIRHNSDMKITRRYFFTLVAYATGGLLVYGSKVHAADKIPDGYALPTADEPIPKAMKYMV